MKKGAVMRCVRPALAMGIVCAMAVLVPASARGEPISVSTASSTSGFAQQGGTMDPAMLSLGTVFLPSVDSVGTLLFSGPMIASDVVVSFMLEGLGSFNTLRLELLDPKGGGDDHWDPKDQPSYVPAGY